MNNHEKKFILYGHSCQQNTVYVLSDRTGNRTWAVRSESERSPHWANVADSCGGRSKELTANPSIGQIMRASPSQWNPTPHPSWFEGCKADFWRGSGIVHQQPGHQCNQELYEQQSIRLWLSQHLPLEEPRTTSYRTPHSTLQWLP